MKTFYVIIILIFSVIKCSNTRNGQNDYTSVERWLGKKITIPEDTLNIKINNLTQFNEATLYKPNNIKLIVAINGDCGSCINKLKAVEDFTDDVLALYKDISLLVYVHFSISNYINFEILNDTEIHFKYPFLYDFKNRFLKENNFPSNIFYHMLLCDKNNKVLMIGDFTQNKELKELYLKKIQEYASPLIYDYPLILPIEKKH